MRYDHLTSTKRQRLQSYFNSHRPFYISPVAPCTLLVPSVPEEVARDSSYRIAAILIPIRTRLRPYLSMCRSPTNLAARLTHEMAGGPT
jgi:hypothetical protein